MSSVHARIVQGDGYCAFCWNRHAQRQFWRTCLKFTLLCGFERKNVKMHTKTTRKHRSMLKVYVFVCFRNFQPKKFEIERNWCETERKSVKLSEIVEGVRLCRENTNQAKNTFPQPFHDPPRSPTITPRSPTITPRSSHDRRGRLFLQFFDRWAKFCAAEVFFCCFHFCEVSVFCLPLLRSKLCFSSTFAK